MIVLDHAASIGPAPLLEQFDGTTSTCPHSWCAAFDWDFGDGSAHQTQGWVSHTYPAGIYTVVLKVTDGAGATATASVLLTSQPVNPSDGGAAAPTAALAGGPSSGPAPLSVYLEGTSKASTPSGWIASCSLDFGDGTKLSQCWGIHAYASGTWTAAFTATDNLGKSATATLAINAAAAVQDGGTADAGSPDAGIYDAGTPPPYPDGGAAWPPAPYSWFGIDQGASWARSVSADEGGNVWAVNDDGVYTLRYGDARFSFHGAVGQMNLGEPPFAVCGGAPGKAFVGYLAPESVNPFDEPAAIRAQGDLDRLALDVTGAVTLEHHYDLHNTNDPRYNETRSVVSCIRQNDGRSPYYGDLYLGTNHAVTRVQGDGYADHRHVLFSNAAGSLVIGYNWAVSFEPTGTLFMANEFKVGVIAPTPYLLDWLSFNLNPWVLDTFVPAGADGDREAWHANAVTPDGKHWVGSGTKGLWWMIPTPRQYGQVPGAPDLNIQALAADSDNGLWVGTHAHGLWRLQQGQWSRFALPSNNVLGLFLDTRTIPRTVYIASDLGVAIYHGP